MTIDGRKKTLKPKTIKQLNNYINITVMVYTENLPKEIKMVAIISGYQFKGELIGKRIIEGAGDYWVEIPTTGYQDSWHTFPIISATITAYARAKILNALCHNQENVVYCDTDSIKCLNEVKGIPVGDEPGEWGYEYTETQKFYRQNDMVINVRACQKSPINRSN